MRRTLLLLCFLVSTCHIFAQPDLVHGNIFATDTVELSILGVYPDSFPNVSVVFKAETPQRKPIWNLMVQDMRAEENKRVCEVISVEPLSDNKPIHIGLVLDHSGSMMYDFSQLYDAQGNPLFTLNEQFEPIMLGYSAPIDRAKQAVKGFVTSFDGQKDFLGLVGFSTTVDRRVELTHDTNRIIQSVDSMEADFSTALYDAMIEGVRVVNKADGVKVLVVLTDGHDNASRNGWRDVVGEANRANVPVYVIGLGDVSRDTLSMIARSTKGTFYHTQTAAALDSIYRAISEQVQAYYNLVYRSDNLSAMDSMRSIELSFNVKDLHIITEPESALFPTELIAYMESKEKTLNYLLYGGLSILAIALLGTIVYRVNRWWSRPHEPVELIQLYPNPASDIINLDYTGQPGPILIYNSMGQEVKSFYDTSDKHQFDVSDLPTGTYFLIMRGFMYETEPEQFRIVR
jgi:Ca-activated chloride channel family protein